MALLVFFSQLKAVTAEFFGHHAQMDDAGVCTMLIVILILCYLSYKLGRFLERKSQVLQMLATSDTLMPPWMSRTFDWTTEWLSRERPRESCRDQLREQKTPQ